MRQVDAAHVVDVYDHHFQLVANADHRFDIGYAMLCKFADVNHAVLAGEYLHESAERHYSHDPAGVGIADLDVLGQRVDGVLGLFGIVFIGRTDNHSAVILNIDRDTELVDHSANDRSTRPDNRTDLVGRDLHRDHSRCVLAQVISGIGDCLGHAVKDLQPGDACLLQGFTHDFERDSLDLDVHLERGHAVPCPGDFEVHVTRMVFRTLNIGEDCIFSVFARNEPHCDTGDGGLDWHTAIHHRQGSGADTAHRRRSVRTEGLRYESDRVREVGLTRNDWLQGPFGKCTVADFAPSGKTEPPCLTGRIGREVVVMNEVFLGFQAICVEPLALARRCECQGAKYLGFTAREQSRTVDAGKVSDLGIERPQFVEFPAIGADIVFKDGFAHCFSFQGIERRFDVSRIVVVPELFNRVVH